MLELNVSTRLPFLSHLMKDWPGEEKPEGGVKRARLRNLHYSQLNVPALPL